MGDVCGLVSEKDLLEDEKGGAEIEEAVFLQDSTVFDALASGTMPASQDTKPIPMVEARPLPLGCSAGGGNGQPEVEKKT